MITKTYKSGIDHPQNEKQCKPLNTDVKRQLYRFGNFMTIEAIQESALTKTAN